MSDRERAEQFLNQQTHMVVAIVLPDGSPWAVPVKIQNRLGSQFEWDSRLDTAHSRTLESNQTMAITIFQKQADKEFGFYAKGRGELVTKRDDGFGRYRFIANQAWINDETFVKRSVALDVQ